MAPSPREASPKLQQAMEECREKVNRTIANLLPATDLAEAPLFDAMRYAVLNGGKRLRPFMVMEGARVFGVDPLRARRVAAAAEFVHCYSLVHDDLPAMDDSDLRRGKPSLHKAYDEATAILAGDALLTLSFDVLSDPETHEDPRVRIELVSSLAGSSGMHGMVGGQMLDMIGEKQAFDVGTISRMQRMKTGKLIAFCCEAGGILGKANPAHRAALKNYAHDLGLAFQVTDDLLDVTGDTKNLGKPTGKDGKKATFVTTMGIEQAKMRAEMLVEQAIRHLHVFDGGRVDLLKDLARYVLNGVFDRSFYFLRHGETDWNKIGKMQGWTDIPLNETGEAQAGSAGAIVKNLSIDVIIASPLSRALKTAEILNLELGRPLKVDQRLRERNYGVFEGLTRDDFDAWRKKAVAAGIVLPEETGYPCPEGAEPYAVFRERIAEAVMHGLAAHPEQNIMFVAHGGVYRVLQRILSSELDHCPNAQPFLFDKTNDGWILSVIEDQ